jgi:hypothetical protein
MDLCAKYGLKPHRLPCCVEGERTGVHPLIHGPEWVPKPAADLQPATVAPPAPAKAKYGRKPS